MQTDYAEYADSSSSRKHFRCFKGQIDITRRLWIFKRFYQEWTQKMPWSRKKKKEYLSDDLNIMDSMMNDYIFQEQIVAYYPEASGYHVGINIASSSTNLMNGEAETSGWVEIKEKWC